MITENNQSNRGNPNIAELGKGTQFKPGQSGNPKGPPKAKIQLWRYVQEYSEMKESEIEQIDQSKLTLSQLAALQFVRLMAVGSWKQVKEALDRDEGPITQKIGIQEEPMDFDGTLEQMAAMGFIPKNPMFQTPREVKGLDDEG